MILVNDLYFVILVFKKRYCKLYCSISMCRQLSLVPAFFISLWYVIKPFTCELSKTKLAIKREDFASLRSPINLGGAVINSDYRGNVGVILFKFSQNVFKVCVGDSIAQLILVKFRIVDVLEVDELSNTERGPNGFGSTEK